MDEPAEALSGQAYTLTGPADAVARLVGSRAELHRDQMGTTTRATVRGAFDSGDAPARRRWESSRAGLSAAARGPPHRRVSGLRTQRLRPAAPAKEMSR